MGILRQELLEEGGESAEGRWCGRRDVTYSDELNVFGLYLYSGCDEAGEIDEQTLGL